MHKDKMEDHWRKYREAFSLQDELAEDGWKHLPEPHDMEIEIKQVLESESTRLLRLRSDMRLCNVLSAGILCLLVIDVFLGGLSAHTTARIISILVLVLISLRGWRMETFYADAAINSWIHHFVVKKYINVTTQSPLSRHCKDKKTVLGKIFSFLIRL